MCLAVLLSQASAQRHYRRSWLPGGSSSCSAVHDQVVKQAAKYSGHRVSQWHSQLLAVLHPLWDICMVMQVSVWLGQARLQLILLLWCSRRSLAALLVPTGYKVMQQPSRGEAVVRCVVGGLVGAAFVRTRF